MAGNVATVLNPENYKQIYNEGKVIFDKNTYNDLGDDLKDMFSGQSYGYTREKRKKEKEAKRFDSDHSKVEEISQGSFNLIFFKKHNKT